MMQFQIRHLPLVQLLGCMRLDEQVSPKVNYQDHILLRTSLSLPSRPTRYFKDANIWKTLAVIELMSKFLQRSGPCRMYLHSAESSVHETGEYYGSWTPVAMRRSSLTFQAIEWASQPAQ